MIKIQDTKEHIVKFNKIDTSDYIIMGVDLFPIPSVDCVVLYIKYQRRVFENGYMSHSHSEYIDRTPSTEVFIIPKTIFAQSNIVKNTRANLEHMVQQNIKQIEELELSINTYDLIIGCDSISQIKDIGQSR